VIRARRAGTRVLVAGLAVAAVAAGGAAAAVPMFVFPVQARLAPISGAKSAGHFSGTLARPDEQPVQTQALPSNGNSWRLRWKVSFPSLGRPAAVTLRVASRNGAPAVVRVLSARCSTSARGMVTLTGSQASRIVRGDAVVTVRAGSAKLRGAVKMHGATGR
jgi:hypothetical protein